MQPPVGEHGLPNNWVQVVKVDTPERPLYVAAVGSERLDVVLEVDPAGRIRSARMDIPWRSSSARARTPSSPCAPSPFAIASTGP